MSDWPHASSGIEYGRWNQGAQPLSGAVDEASPSGSPKGGFFSSPRRTIKTRGRQGDKNKEIKTIDSPFCFGRIRRRVDFLERSYKIDFDRNVPRPAKAG